MLYDSKTGVGWTRVSIGDQPALQMTAAGPPGWRVMAVVHEVNGVLEPTVLAMYPDTRVLPLTDHWTGQDDERFPTLLEWSEDSGWAVQTELLASVPSSGITSALLRRVPVGSLRDQVEALERLPGIRSRHLGPQARPPRRNRSGRAGLPDEHYLDAALAYAQAVGERSPHPIKDAAKALGITPLAAREDVARARKRKLLAPTVKGRVNGKLTDKALALAARREGARLGHGLDR